MESISSSLFVCSFNKVPLLQLNVSFFLRSSLLTSLSLYFARSHLFNVYDTPHNTEKRRIKFAFVCGCAATSIQHEERMEMLLKNLALGGEMSSRVLCAERERENFEAIYHVK
jgi:hypothetical protein